MWKFFSFPKNIIVLTVLTLTGGVILFWFILTMQIQSGDFRNNLWSPANLLLQGNSPYNTRQLLGNDLNPVWFPMAIGAFCWLGWLALPIATNLWFCFNLILLVLLIFLITNGASYKVSRVVG